MDLNPIRSRAELKDVDWIRGLWPGKLILKGILDVGGCKDRGEDGGERARCFQSRGAQLDGAPSSISALPKIADAVGSEIELMFHGVRTGQDVLRALALGARSCMIGRAYVYGLGSFGEEGVAKAIDILAKELDVAMALTGTSRAGDLDRSIISQ